MRGTSEKTHSFRFPRRASAAGNRLLHGFNAFGTLLLEDGRRMLRIDPDELLEHSARLCGRDDFGDPPFQEAFRILVRSFDAEADLNLVGRITVRSELLRLLGNRLKMVQDRKLHPEIAGEQVRRPLFITGLPRSGTSFLHALLARDPAARAPRVWELMHPSPPPEERTYRCDPRIVETEKELRWIDVLMPDFDTCHFIDARSPQECIAITDHSFYSYLFESMYFVTSYRSWHDSQDKLPAYRFHRQFLQQLQWRCPGSHWVLKAPSHLGTLEPLLAVYPDADIVMTHRDPLKVLASTASFAEILRSPFTFRKVREGLGEEVSRRWSESAGCAVRFRACHPEFQERFLDIAYADLLRDPLGVVRGIYRHFGRELTDEALASMRSFIEAEAPAQQGVHHYTLEEFGLDPVTERERFREYTEYYGVPAER